MPGKEQEDINYTLQVDTGEYDLLLLRYAIVEQNSGHRATEQPYFTFTIQDTAAAANAVSPVPVRYFAPMA